MASTWEDALTAGSRWLGQLQSEKEEQARRDQALVAAVVIDSFLADPAERQQVKQMLGLGS